MENQSTIIKLDNITGITYNNANNVQVRSASFEEAFGDFSEARGDRRKRRHKRRMERLAEKRERKQAKRLIKSDRQEARAERKSGRQEARAERRRKRKTARQDDRMQRTESRLSRRKRRSEGRAERKMIKEQGANERENYALEQEIGRDNLLPEDNTQEQQGGGYQEQGGGYQEEQGGGYQEEQGGGYQEQGGGYQEQGGGYQEEYNSAPQGYQEEYNSAPQGYQEEYNSAPQGYQEEYYGEEEEPYSQEETEFSDGYSFSGLDGMEDEDVSYLEDDYNYTDDDDDDDPNITDAVRKLSNNQEAYDDLRTTRDKLLENNNDTSNIDGEIEKCYGRICEIENQLDDYSNADGKNLIAIAKIKRQIARQKIRNANKRKARKRKMLALKMKGKKLANMIPAVRLAKALRKARKKKAEGTEVKTGFDSYSQIGRPVIYNGQELSDGHASDYYENDEFKGVDSNYGLTDNYYLNASGTTGKSNSILSIAIGVGIGVGILYLAKRKNLI
jgi:hypothetical protein